MPSRPASLSCPSEVALLDYAEGRLPADLAARMAAHAEHCARCDMALSWRSRTQTAAAYSGGSGAANLSRSLRLLPGRRLGRYLLKRPIGRGAMGLVYEAKDEVLQRDVALKLLMTAASDGVAYERALGEARSMARLTHPNVVRVYDVGALDGVIAVSMELVDGATLGEWLGARPARDAVLDVFAGIARALAAAHRAGIVHRDLKPANVLIDDEGRPKVTDFGLAALLDAPDAANETRGIAGTPAYVAPEVLCGEAAGPAADQFALGVCLYEALTGSRPYVARTFDEARTRADAKELAWTSAVPGAMRRVILRLLERAPADRYPDMNAVVDALGQARGRAPRRARPWVTAGALLVVVLGAAGAVARSRAPGPSKHDAPFARLAPSSAPEPRAESSGSTETRANASAPAASAPQPPPRPRTAPKATAMTRPSATAPTPSVAPATSAPPSEPDDAWLLGRR